MLQKSDGRTSPRFSLLDRLSMASSIVIKRNLALVGPPGSGKGSYGRSFAERWNIPLITVSNVLRQHSHDVEAGTLVEDEVVSDLLRNHLPKQPCLLDGFPRTLNQVHLMEETWPRNLQVSAVVDLDVPRQVCKEKLLGRRLCTKCGGNFNVHAVHILGFHLPAQLPQDCDCDEKYFTTRPDDVEEVVDERLDAHFVETEPIFDYFDRRGRLLRFAPYMGYEDVPRFHSTVETWLSNMEQEKKKTTVVS